MDEHKICVLNPIQNICHNTYITIKNLLRYQSALIAWDRGLDTCGWRRGRRTSKHVLSLVPHMVVSWYMW
jgi:hypothetical protein